MGKEVAKACGMNTKVLGSINSGHTSPDYTIRKAQAFRDAGV